jgi:hypothetical protein
MNFLPVMLAFGTDLLKSQNKKMGVIKHFSADSRDFSTPIPTRIERVVSTPDPSNFEILKREAINGFTLLFVNYPDCKNYEGNKILVYDRKVCVTALIMTKKLDPHFFTKGDSPIARFEPTDRGWEMAKSFARYYLAE